LFYTSNNIKLRAIVWTTQYLIKIVSFCIFFILKSTKTNTVYNRVSIKHFIGAIVSTNRGIMSSNVDSVH